MNNTTIIGNIGKPPELRYTPSKMAVAEFSVATTRGKDDKKQTTWHTITAFGKTAENAAASLQKGNRVIVIVQDNNSRYWLLGADNGLEATAGTAGTGTAFGDRSGYEMTLTGMEPDPMLNIAAATFSASTTQISGS